MKNSNKIFLLFYLLLLIAICLFNYIVNPYNAFRSKNLSINPDFNDNPYLQMKLTKNKKFKSVIIGGSSVKDLNLAKDKKEIADISFYYATINDINEILNYYLKLHPETKKIYFALELKLFDKRENKIQKENKQYLTPFELYKLLLSINTTKNSIKKLNKKNTKQQAKSIEEEIALKSINKIIPYKNKEEYLKNAISELDKLFYIANKNKIEIICLIPPSHANFQLRTKERIGSEKYEIEKYILDKLNYIINLETVNEYTTIPTKDKNTYFFDENHANEKYKYIAKEIIFENPNKYKNLYTILTKDNYKQEAKKENTKLLIYKKEHNEEYQNYLAKEKEIWNKINNKKK